MRRVLKHVTCVLFAILGAGIATPGSAHAQRPSEGNHICHYCELQWNQESWCVENDLIERSVCYQGVDDETDMGYCVAWGTGWECHPEFLA